MSSRRVSKPPARFEPFELRPKKIPTAQAPPKKKSPRRAPKPPARFDPEPEPTPKKPRKTAAAKGSKAKARKLAAKATAVGQKKGRKRKIPTHTDDGVPIVNATMAQIRKGAGKAAQQLVRIPQVAERSKLYAEAAEVIGERESLALPYHGGRTWKCEVRLSDDNGASGTNRKGVVATRKGKDEDAPKKTRTAGLTPLFRWYRGNLVLATLPYILDDIVEVDNKQQGKKRWANGMSDDEGLDSSDEEWDVDEKFQLEAKINMRMEASNLTESAYEDTSHPMPTVTRSWISPDLQRFHSRKGALAHAEALVKKDLLIDRTLFGYGHNGVRLRPVKPTRKLALEAGLARFVRDGLWIVGQEEQWIEQRRDVLVKKQERRQGKSAGEDEGDADASVEEKKPAAKEESKGVSVEELAMATASAAAVESNAGEENKEDDADMAKAPVAALASATGNVQPVLDAAADQTMAASRDSNVVTPLELVASAEASKGAEASNGSGDVETKKETAPKRAPGTKPPPPFVPSTHYRLTPKQITQCYSACTEHYEGVMRTVQARSLHHELSDGFDVLRERGRGRYDMELPAFDTDAFSFLTDTKKAAWMPVVKQILGDDAKLVHTGCFISLPGSDTQVYHQDGVHLNKKTHKPCYAINVFIPLVDYDMSNGPTEFCLGTHYLGHEVFVKDRVYTPCVTAGTPVIFDYRLGHRGLRNYSQAVRPVVYLTYSSAAGGKEFRDSVNFSRKRYRKLGDFTEAPLSREERASKRRREEK
ncbi:hypothetical protein ACHAXT_001056 [Thalassiosira profunda]